MGCQIGGVKLIFLDEISMVGNAMSNIQIYNRLKDIKGSSKPFGGVSVIAVGDLFLAPNLWNELFKMFELDEVMRQGESKEFAEMLNRLREGKHTEQDIVNLKQRIIEANNSNYPLDAPHLFTENEKVNKFNDRAHRSISGTKYTIKAHDSVIGATSTELRDKIMKQIPNLEPKNTKQLHYNLNLAVEERTEISLNTRIDDGMTNGASNVIKLIQLPTIWCHIGPI